MANRSTVILVTKLNDSVTQGDLHVRFLSHNRSRYYVILIGETWISSQDLPHFYSALMNYKCNGKQVSIIRLVWLSLLRYFSRCTLPNPFPLCAFQTNLINIVSFVS